ncbi:MAG: hypothetical protein H0U49_00690 [Parachlamydiaceae bacterium]|nr:hypothetical protein [Parachlamydiaceae bacterium]
MLLENVVQQSTAQLLPDTPTLPSIIRSAYSGLHWIHCRWHWYRQGKTYLNPDNFLKLVSGHALNFWVGDSRYVRLAAQCVMVSNCILECVREQSSLNRSYRKLIDAVFQRHPTITSHKWNKKPISRFISPSTSQRIYSWLFEVEQYFRTVGYRIATFVKHFFKLSMVTIDAVDAFSLNPEIGNRAVNEFFVNGNNCLDAIANNREEFIAKLTENKEVIDCVLKTIGTNYKAEQFIGYVDKTVAKVESASNTLGSVNKAIGYGVTESLKTLFFLVMSTVGAADAVPDRFVPTYGALNHNTELKNGEARYAPVCRLNKDKHKPPAESRFPKINLVNKGPRSLNEAYAQALKNQMKSRVN